MGEWILAIPEEKTESPEDILFLLSEIREKELNATIFVIAHQGENSKRSLRLGLGDGVIYGNVRDLFAFITSGKKQFDWFFWLSGIQQARNPSWITDVIKELQQQPPWLVLFCRKSIPMNQRIIGRILFPDYPDPFSGVFAIASKNIQKFPVPEQTMGVPFFFGIQNAHQPVEIKFIGPEEDITRRGLFEFFREWTTALMLIVYGLSHRESIIGEEVRKVVKFGIVGLSGIFVNTGVLYSLTEFLGLYYILSSALAIETSIATNFLLNERWTFKGRAYTIPSVWRRFVSYNTLAIGGMCINIVILFLLTEYAGSYYLFANLIGILCGFSWNYITNRNVTWK